jgi:membrane protein required for colicin V production
MFDLNWIDCIILAVFAISTLIGIKRGLLKEITSLLIWIAAFIIAILFAAPAAKAYSGGDASTVAISTCFVILFVAALIVGAIISYFINTLFQATVISFGNRLLGGIFGFARSFILVVVVIFIAELLPPSDQSDWQQSRLIHALQPTVDWIGDTVSPSLMSDVKKKVNKTLKNMNSQVKDITNSVQDKFNN